MKPGLYEIESIQEICLQAAGTWYSPTFSGWGGTWQNIKGGKDATTVIRGNYASGAGNDSIAIRKGGAGWDEWRDDESYINYVDNVTFSKIGSCTDASWHKLPHVNRSNPAQ